MEKNIHQIWVGPYEMPDMEKFFVEQVKSKNPDYKHFLWTDKNLPKLPKRIKEHIEYFTKEENYAFVADVLRIVLIMKYGGVYMDVDWECHKGFSDLNLENYNGFFPHHDEFNVANTFFGCAKKTSFIKYLYELLLDANIGDHFFPYWFNKGVRDYYKVEDLPDTEYFPVITEKCKSTGALLLSRWDEDKIKYLNINNGFNKYFQHFALHSWDSKHKKYFEENNINYCDSIYKLNYKLD